MELNTVRKEIKGDNWRVIRDCPPFILTVKQTDMNNLKKTVIWFLLLVPFRLPIGTLLIKLLDYIAQIGNVVLPASILCGNVIVSKIIYNLVFSSFD